MDRIDFKRTQRDLYSATGKIKPVEAQEAAFLCVDGQGEPGGEAFQQAIQGLYSVAYTLKFAVKEAGVIDFVVAPLESLWYDDPKQVPDMSKWRWKVLIRIPDEVTPEQVQDARDAVREKKGIDVSNVMAIRWDEGSCLQTMHLGPYDQVAPTYVKLDAEAEEKGMAVSGPGHEIYLSDPRRVAPEKLKTIVRMPVAKENRQ